MSRSNILCLIYAHATQEATLERDFIVRREGGFRNNTATITGSEAACFRPAVNFEGLFTCNAKEAVRLDFAFIANKFIDLAVKASGSPLLPEKCTGVGVLLLSEMTISLALDAAADTVAV